MGTKALCEMFSGHKHGDSGCDSAITMDSLDCEDAVWTRNHGDICQSWWGSVVRLQVVSCQVFPSGIHRWAYLSTSLPELPFNSTSLDNSSNNNPHRSHSAFKAVNLTPFSKFNDHLWHCCGLKLANLTYPAKYQTHSNVSASKN
jgi:hypothetical protein